MPSLSSLCLKQTHKHTKTTTLGCRSLNRERWVTDNSSKIFLMRHLPGCRTVNSLVDSAEQLTLFSSAGDVDTYRATQGARKFMDFFYLSDSNRCHKTKIRLKKKKKSVYTTKTYFTTDQRYLLQRATQHKKSLHIQQQHGNMLTCLNVSKSRQDSHKLKQKLKHKEL